MADPTIVLGNPVITENRGTVQVTFTINGDTYKRRINGVFNPPQTRTQSTYDKPATLIRAQEVLNGVLNKIDAGVIVLPDE